MKRLYPLIIEDAGANLCAYFPDVSGCTTHGATVEEIRRNAKEALALHLEESEAPKASTLAELEANPDVELDGTETLAWIEYEQQHALA